MRIIKMGYACALVLCVPMICGIAHAQTNQIESQRHPTPLINATLSDAAQVVPAGEDALATLSFLMERQQISDSSSAKDGDSAPTKLTIQEPLAQRSWTDHVPRGESAYPTFGSQVSEIKWETLGLIGYFTAINSPKLFRETKPFHFKDEGWFGKSTDNLGVDKLTHAFNSYLLAEFLHDRLHRKTNGASGDALTAALLASGVMIYSELYDGIETTSGFSLEDVAMNTAGAAFSVLRNTVPGLKEKLDFRLLLIPNSDIYTRTGKRHYAQQRYLLALKMSGFEKLKETPLRFAELHAGYYASGFTHQAIARGETPRRHLFFGVGLNLRELFFPSPKSNVSRIAATSLNYIQIPYTAFHWD
ncbi:DUF2279 domain-containing protein [Rhizorhapis sp. SPR117]|uniref:DUF2279 domain-containing protein n=1 Tax=Rhizorhapis sp. SPR117 TaxID=2912611 RepID=UPI001F3B4A6D|nr:YfiM family protein [Rhizorhapis sp. SPR117]